MDDSDMFQHCFQPPSAAAHGVNCWDALRSSKLMLRFALIQSVTSPTGAARAALVADV